MRLLILTIVLLGLAMPAFAECGSDHQAGSDNTTATSTPTSTTNSGG